MDFFFPFPLKKETIVGGCFWGWGEPIGCHSNLHMRMERCVAMPPSLHTNSIAQIKAEQRRRTGEAGQLRAPHRPAFPGHGPNPGPSETKIQAGRFLKRV